MNSPVLLTWPRLPGQRRRGEGRFRGQCRWTLGWVSVCELELYFRFYFFTWHISYYVDKYFPATLLNCKWFVLLVLLVQWLSQRFNILYTFIYVFFSHYFHCSSLPFGICGLLLMVVTTDHILCLSQYHWPWCLWCSRTTSLNKAAL